MRSFEYTSVTIGSWIANLGSSGPGKLLSAKVQSAVELKWGDPSLGISNQMILGGYCMWASPYKCCHPWMVGLMPSSIQFVQNFVLYVVVFEIYMLVRTHALSWASAYGQTFILSLSLFLSPSLSVPLSNTIWFFWKGGTYQIYLSVPSAQKELPNQHS